MATLAPLPAAALMRAEATRVLLLLRPTMATFAPRAASASAAAKPMPLVAPVIRICLSFTAQQSKAMARADDHSDGQEPSASLDQPLTNGVSETGFLPRQLGIVAWSREGRQLVKSSSGRGNGIAVINRYATFHLMQQPTEGI